MSDDFVSRRSVRVTCRSWTGSRGTGGVVEGDDAGKGTHNDNNGLFLRQYAYKVLNFTLQSSVRSLTAFTKVGVPHLTSSSRVP